MEVPKRHFHGDRALLRRVGGFIWPGTHGGSSNDRQKACDQRRCDRSGSSSRSCFLPPRMFEEQLCQLHQVGWNMFNEGTPDVCELPLGSNPCKLLRNPQSWLCPASKRLSAETRPTRNTVAEDWSGSFSHVSFQINYFYQTKRNSHLSHIEIHDFGPSPPHHSLLSTPPTRFFLMVSRTREHEVLRMYAQMVNPTYFACPPVNQGDFSQCPSP